MGIQLFTNEYFSWHPEIEAILGLRGDKYYSCSHTLGYLSISLRRGKWGTDLTRYIFFVREDGTWDIKRPEFQSLEITEVYMIFEGARLVYEFTTT